MSRFNHGNNPDAVHMTSQDHSIYLDNNTSLIKNSKNVHTLHDINTSVEPVLNIMYECDGIHSSDMPCDIIVCADTPHVVNYHDGRYNSPSITVSRNSSRSQCGSSHSTTPDRSLHSTTPDRSPCTSSHTPTTNNGKSTCSQCLHAHSRTLDSSLYPCTHLSSSGVTHVSHVTITYCISATSCDPSTVRNTDCNTNINMAAPHTTFTSPLTLFQCTSSTPKSEHLTILHPRETNDKETPLSEPPSHSSLRSPSRSCLWDDQKPSNPLHHHHQAPRFAW